MTTIAPPQTRATIERRTAPAWLRKAGSQFLNVWAILGYCFLFAPIVVIVLFSFNDPVGRFNLEWQHFTLDNWTDPLRDSSLNDALWKSLKIAFIAMVVSTIFGALIAMALVRYRFRGGALVNILLVLPLTTPEIVLGASLLYFFVDRDQQRGFETVVFAHIMFCVSFVALTVKARLRGFDWTLEDAAMDLGASPFRTFTKVTFPLILPGILAAALLAFSLSIDDFIITSFTAGQEVTFPLRIAGAFQREISQQVNVMATMILLVSVSLIGAGTLMKHVRTRS